MPGPGTSSSDSAGGIGWIDGNAADAALQRGCATIAAMENQLDPGAHDPDLGYLVMQLGHIGAPVQEAEEATEMPASARCRFSGLTIPECCCASCTRELIMRYAPSPILG